MTNETLRVDGDLVDVDRPSGTGGLPWHLPRRMRDLMLAYDRGEIRTSDTIFVYSPCDGWHDIWLMSYEVERLEQDGKEGTFTHWMKSPPPPEDL